jgi:hypothetical protein
MERRRSGGITDEMDADGMEQKPNTRNVDELLVVGRDEDDDDGSRDKAFVPGEMEGVLRVGRAWNGLVGEWRPQGGQGGNAEGSVRRKRGIGN